jgi:hypothetical protein
MIEARVGAEIHFVFGTAQWDGESVMQYSLKASWTG